MSENPTPTRKSSRPLLRELHAALMQEITHHPDGVPCQQRPRGIDWLDPHPDQQQAAAELCNRCPAFRACKRYITNTRRAPGVWAGTTEADRHRRAAVHQTRGTNRQAPAA